MTHEGGDQECLKNELPIAAQQGKNFTPFETRRESSKISKATSEHIARISNEKGQAKNSARCHSFSELSSDGTDMFSLPFS
jgi:hypothetical protein